MVFQVMAPRRPARSTFSSTISIRTIPLPMVLATAVPKTKAAMKFQKAAQTTARKGVRTGVETTVAMELAASCQPFENSKVRVRKMTTRRREKLDKRGNPRGGGEEGLGSAITGWRSQRHRGSGGFQDDAFDDVGDVFALVDGGLDDFEDFFPLDDLDGIFLFIEELGDERAAEAVAIVFVAVDLDAVLERFLRPFQCANSHLDLAGNRHQDLDEIGGSPADAL